MSASIVHRRLGRALRFDDDGIQLHRLWRRPVQVPWAAVVFISPTPAVECVAGGYRVTPALQALADPDRFVLDIVLDADAVRGLALPVQPLVHLPDRCLWSEDLQRSALSSSSAALFALVFRHCRHELLCLDA